MAGSLVALLVGLAALRGAPVAFVSKAKGHRISKRTWATLLFPNVVIHACGGTAVWNLVMSTVECSPPLSWEVH